LRAVERVTRTKLAITDAPVKPAPAPAPIANSGADGRPQRNRKPASQKPAQKNRRPEQKTSEHRQAVAPKATTNGDRHTKKQRPFRRESRKSSVALKDA